MDNTPFSISQIRYYQETFKSLEVAEDVKQFSDTAVPEITVAAQLSDDVEKQQAISGLVRAFRNTVRVSRESFIEAHTHHFSGLANRRLFKKVAGEELQLLGTGQSRGTGMIMLDVDKLKAVNDHYGMPAGDKLLTRVAERANKSIEGTDVIAHFGGDEFAILISDSDSDTIHRLLNNVKREFEDFSVEIEDRQIPVGVSMGLAEAKTGETYSEIMSRADKAMKADKAIRAPVRGELEAAITSIVADDKPEAASE